MAHTSLRAFFRFCAKDRAVLLNHRLSRSSPPHGSFNKKCLKTHRSNNFKKVMPLAVKNEHPTDIQAPEPPWKVCPWRPSTSIVISVFPARNFAAKTYFFLAELSKQHPYFEHYNQNISWRRKPPDAMSKYFSPASQQR